MHRNFLNMRLSHLGKHPVWRSTARKAVPLAGSSRTLHTEPGLENSILLAVVPGSTQVSGLFPVYPPYDMPLCFSYLAHFCDLLPPLLFAKSPADSCRMAGFTGPSDGVATQRVSTSGFQKTTQSARSDPAPESISSPLIAQFSALHVG